MKPSFVLLGLALMLLTLATDTAADEPVLRRRVLVLHSYGPDFSWTRDQHAGILSVLESPQVQANYRVDYMDAKHQESPEYLATLLELFRKKYVGQHFDGVILTDNNALAFAAKHRAELFPDAFIAASGINNLQSIPKNAGDMNIILESVPHLETLNAALRQNPGTRSIYVMIDDTLTGQSIRRDFLEQTRDLARRVHIEVLPPKPLAWLIQFALGRAKGDLIYLLVYFQDPTGRSFSPTEVPRAIAASSPVPVYVAWDFQLGTGVVGGYVQSGYGHGQKAAQTLQERLSGKRPPAVYDQTRGIAKATFDYRALERFGIPLSSLPQNAVLLNRPQSYFQKHRQVILITLGVIGVLGVIIALLALNVLKQRKINRSNARILSLNREMIEMQVDLLSTLGEVIETRSRETANHVRRVAAYSGLLGRKYGLSPEEITLLETVSPMHDVGKIGIPEIILNKPERLTSDEHDMIKHHTVIGHKILHSCERKLMTGARDIALQHHERWDGTGYPCGLKGEEISVLARITALADVFDALSTERVYKKAWPREEVLEYIREQRGAMFDPRLVDLLFENLEEVEAIKLRLADAPCDEEGFCLSGPLVCPLKVG
jgi:HD-GYP domain-containing protein (c-di-GMP phosphodiesterase class II)